MSDALPERLEMMLVMRWLEEGAPETGALPLDVGAAAEELGLESDRAGVLAVMEALGALEERGLVSVHWPGGVAPEAGVTLSQPLRRDAQRLFGHQSGPPGA